MADSRLLDITNVKAAKGRWSDRAGGKHYLCAMLYLSPHKSGGYGNVCPSGGSCVASCLGYAGAFRLADNKARARKNRTAMWFKAKGDLLAALKHEIAALIGKEEKWARWPPAKIHTAMYQEAREKYGWGPVPTIEKGGKRYQRITRATMGAERYKLLQEFARLPEGAKYETVVRLNGTSDLPWENTKIMEAFAATQFYDYTKVLSRMDRYLAREMPENYHLTFSMGGVSDAQIPKVLSRGGNVTMVFGRKVGGKVVPSAPPRHFGGDIPYRKQNGSTGTFHLPETPVLDGDTDDLRFLDEQEKWAAGIKSGCIIGLRYKPVTDVKRATAAATAISADLWNDIHEGFVFDPGDRPLHPMKPNPSRAASVTSFRVGCGGTNLVLWED